MIDDRKPVSRRGKEGLQRWLCISLMRSSHRKRLRLCELVDFDISGPCDIAECGAVYRTGNEPRGRTVPDSRRPLSARRGRLRRRACGR